MKEKKKLIRIGNSQGIILPSWWIKLNNVKEVELEIHPDRITVRRSDK